MRSLLIATENHGKQAEFRVLLEDLPLHLVFPDDLGLHLDVLENGQTYAENAALKATAYAAASGLIALADDSGLEVDLLKGRPGIHSHRFSPLPKATDADRRAYLLSLLQGKPQPWTAHFHAVVAIAFPGGSVRLSTGECNGEIIQHERGQNGFGYDPVFYIPAMRKTMAELDMGEKNRCSHRARAVMAARSIFREITEEDL